MIPSETPRRNRLSVSITDDTKDDLQNLAAFYNVTPAEIAYGAIYSTLGRPEMRERIIAGKAKRVAQMKDAETISELRRLFNQAH